MSLLSLAPNRYLALATVVLLLSVFPRISIAQIDTEFWFAVPEVTNNHADRPIELKLSSLNAPSTVTIDMPANGTFVPIVVNLAANATQRVDLTPWIDLLEAKPANTILNSGLRIRATADITAYYEPLAERNGNGRALNADIFALKGAEGMGTDFVIPFQNIWRNQNVNAFSSFDIVATEDNTTITITPTRDIVGHTAGVPFTITLDRGEVYSATAVGPDPNDHPFGSTVTSDKPISVTVKEDSQVNNSAWDLGGDQLIPTHVIGDEYIVMKGELNNDDDRAFIVAATDGTQVFVDGVLVATLNRGEMFETQVFNPSMYITSSNPVYVYHVSGFGFEMGAAVLPPTKCTGSRVVNFTRSTDENFYLNVLVPTGGEGNFTLNGDPSLLVAGDFAVVPNTGGLWMAAHKNFNTTDIPVDANSVLANSTHYFHMGLINGIATGGSARYGYFSDYGALDADAGGDTTICALTTTINISGEIQYAGGGQWASHGPGGGTFSPSDTSLTGTYTFTQEEVDSGFTILTLTTISTNGCPAVTDTTFVIIEPPPDVTVVAVDDTVCENNPTLTLDGFVNGSPGSTWIGNGGAFAPDSVFINATYTLSPAEIANGSTKVVLLADSVGICNPSTDTDTLDIFVRPTPTVNAGANQTVCRNNADVTLNGSVTGSGGGRWSGGNGTFLPNDSTLNAVYTPSATEIANGTPITLTLTTIDNHQCLAVTDDMIISFSNAPVVDAGSNLAVCSNATGSLSGSVSGATGGIWTTSGTGTFADSSDLTTTYFPTPADTAAGSIKIYLSSTGNGTCNPVTDSLVMSFTPSPVANAGADLFACFNNPTTPLAGVVANATGGTWSGGGGIFAPNNNTLNTNYTLSGPEVGGGIAQLILTTTGIGNCNPDRDTVIIFVTPSPTADAGIDQNVCANNPNVSLSGAVTNFTANYWETTGDGTFFPDSSSLTATYVPGPNDLAGGSVSLVLTATRFTCSDVTDTMEVLFTPSPTVNAGNDRTVCSNNGAVTLNGSVTVATGGIWTSSGTGSFNNPNSLTATYTPSSNDTANGTVRLYLTTTGNGNCNQVVDSMDITYTPAPTANAGIDQTVCANNATITLNGSVTVANSGTWSGGSGVFTPTAAALSTQYNPTAGEISSGSVQLYLTTTGNNGCNPVQDTIDITITPAPTVDAGADQNVCIDNPTVTLNGAFTVASGGIWANGNGTFTPSNTVMNATYTLTQTEVNNGGVSLFLITTSNGLCSAVADTMEINITPAPTVDAGPNQTLCGAITNVNLNGTVTVASGGTWTTSGTGTFVNANIVDAVYTPSAADKTGSVWLTLTTTGNGTCNSRQDSVQLTFTSVPSIDAGPNQTVCTNDFPIALNGTGSPAQWSTSGTGSFDNINSLNTFYTPSGADTTAGSVTLTLTTLPNGACSVINDNLTITILSGPVANAGPDHVVCADTAGLPLNGNTFAATGSIWSSTGTGSFSPSASNLNATYNFSAGDIGNGSIQLILTAGGNVACSNDVDTIDITIVSSPTVDAGLDQTVCANNANTPLNGLINNAGGAIWTTTGSGNFSDSTDLTATYFPSTADTASGSVKLYLLTTNIGNCKPVIDSLTIVYTPAPTADAGADHTVCADTNGITLNGNVTVATGGTWASSGSGAFTPNNTTLNTTYVPSATDTANGNITIILTTSGNANCNPVSDTMELTITPAPKVNAGNNINVCADAPNVPVNGTVLIASGGAWSSSGSGTFTPGSLTLNTVYNLSANDILSGSVVLNLLTTGNGQCRSVDDNLVITIIQTPTANAGFDQIVCANVANVSLSGSVTGATGGQWTTTGGGAFANANALTTTYTPSASDTINGSVELVLTTTGNGLCNPVRDTMEITFSPVPVVEAGPDVTICADSSYINLNGTVGNATGGEWTSSGTGLFFTNFNDLTGVYTPSTADTTSGSVYIKLSTTGSGACNAAVDSFLLTITPAPKAFAGNDTTICADAGTFALNGSVLIGTGGYWSTSGTGTFSPDSSALNATYIPSAFDTTAGLVVLTLNTTGNGTCRPATDQVNLAITPAPKVRAGSDLAVCADQTLVSLDGTIIAAGGGQWSTLGTGIFVPNNSTIDPQYSLSAADKANGSVSLVLTSTGNGLCTPVTDTINISIAPAPTIDAGNNLTICADSAGVAMNGSVSNAGGVQWSTSGSGSFFPNAFNANATYQPSATDITNGAVVLTITSTGNGTCMPVSDSITLSIDNLPIASANIDKTICTNMDTVQLDGTVVNALGGFWSTTGTGTLIPDTTSLNALYLPSASDKANGIVALVLTTTGNGTCQPVNDVMNINIIPEPTANAGSNKDVCILDDTVSLNVAVNFAPSVVWSTLGSGTFTPDTSTLNASYLPSAGDKALGTVDLVLTVPDTFLVCNAVRDTITVNFNATPVVNAGADQTICTNEFPVQLNGAGPNAGWSTNGTGVFTPDTNALNATYMPSGADTIAGSIDFILTASNLGACPPGKDTVTMTFISGPRAHAGPDISVCADSNYIIFNASVFIATGGDWTTSGSGTFNPDASTLNTQYNITAADKNAGTVNFTLTTTGNGTCVADTDRVVLTITPQPTIGAGFDQSICADADSVPVNGTVTVATGGQWSTTGTGTFTPSNNSLNAYYQITNADSLAGNIDLIFTSTGNGLCNPISDTINLDLTPVVQVDAGPDANICADSTIIPVNGSVSVAGGAVWSTSGSGIFTPTALDTVALYETTSGDIGAGNVTLYLTSTDNGTCKPRTDSLLLTIQPEPIANAGSNDTVCANAPDVNLNGNVTNAGGGQWINSLGIFTPDNITLNAIYTPTLAEITSGAANLVLETTGNGLCGADQDIMVVTILPPPSVAINAGFDQTLCQDVDFVQLNGNVGTAEGGLWTTLGSGTFSPDDTTLTAQYIPSAADTAAGFVDIILETTGNGLCLPMIDTMRITFTPIPTVDAGSDITVCADTSGVAVNGAITVASGGQWTTSGSGSFAPNGTSLSMTYVLSPGDITNGSVSLTLTSTGNGTCKAYNDAMDIFINPAPIANAGINLTTCANKDSIRITGTVQNASGGIWTSSGSGNITPTDSALTMYYHASATDDAGGLVVMTLTTTGNGLCKAVQDQMVLTINPEPVPNAGLDETICEDLTNYTLNGSVLNAGGGIWSSLGSGTFINNSVLNTNYLPSATDIANGNVQLVLTTTNNGFCDPETDTMDLTITPAPVVDAGAINACADVVTGLQLGGSVINATGGIWSSSNGGAFTPNAADLNAVYIPSQSAINNGSVTITLTSTGMGTCNPVTDDINVTIVPLPIANPGEDRTICRGATTLLNAQISPGVNYEWFDSSGVSISTLPTVSVTVNDTNFFILTVTDGKGCQTTDTVHINVIDPPTFNLPPHHCYNDTLVLDANPTGVTPGGIFQWYWEGSLLFMQDTTTLAVDTTGNFVIEYTLDRCSVFDSTDVTAPPVVDGDDVIACENENALLSTTATTGATYAWFQAGAPVGGNFDTLNTVTPIDTTIFTVDVTDLLNCSSTDTIRLIGIPIPVFSIQDSTICQGESVTMNATPVNIPNIDSLAPQYTWTESGNTISTNDSITVNITGLYIATVNIGQCAAADSADILVNPIPDDSLPNSKRFCSETDITVNIDAGITANIISYNWLPNNETTQIITTGIEGYYYLTTTNAFNCSRFDSIFIDDVCPPRLFVPTGFTPNGDGVDDEFQTFGAHYTNYKLTIFNRWGEIIYYTEDPNTPWDGMYLGKEMPIGTYNWIVTYSGLPPYDQDFIKEGTVTILR